HRVGRLLRFHLRPPWQRSVSRPWRHQRQGNLRGAADGLIALGGACVWPQLDEQRLCGSGEALTRDVAGTAEQAHLRQYAAGEVRNAVPGLLRRGHAQAHVLKWRPPRADGSLRRWHGKAPRLRWAARRPAERNEVL